MKYILAMAVIGVAILTIHSLLCEDEETRYDIQDFIEYEEDNDDSNT